MRKWRVNLHFSPFPHFPILSLSPFPFNFLICSPFALHFLILSPFSRKPLPSFPQLVLKGMTNIFQYLIANVYFFLSIFPTCILSLVFVTRGYRSDVLQSNMVIIHNSVQESLPVNQIFFQAAPFQIPILAQLSNPPFKLERNAEFFAVPTRGSN